MWIDDQVLLECSRSLYYKVFVPSSSMVVLGRSNQIELETHPDKCHEDGIPILKRYGGGGTVLLHSGCVVVSIGTWVSSPYNNDKYFARLNQSIISSMEPLFADAEFSQKGYSDIVMGSRKWAGTSLFRSRNYLLYQASLLVDLRIEQIQKYLKHPSKEPDYRKGRDHKSFLMGLGELRPDLSSKTLAEHIERTIEDSVKSHLADEIMAPLEPHIPHLLKRVHPEMSPNQTP